MDRKWNLKFPFGTWNVGRRSWKWQGTGSPRVTHTPSKIIKEHLNDPAYFEAMSALLDEVIKARKAKAIEYEEYLRQIAERVDAGQASETPKSLNTPGSVPSTTTSARTKSWRSRSTKP